MARSPRMERIERALVKLKASRKENQALLEELKRRMADSSKKTAGSNPGSSA